MAIVDDVQQTALSAAIQLFKIDLTTTGVSNEVFYFQASSTDDIVFRGNTYTWLPIEISGIQQGSTSQATPLLSLSNIDMRLLTSIINTDDLIGAHLTFIRTFEKYLNNLNDSERFSENTFIVAQKTQQSKVQLNFQLQTLLDRDSLLIPRRRATDNIIEGFGLIN